MSPEAGPIDQYLTALPADQRTALQSLRKTIRAAAPGATESISYRMPTFKYKGRPLIHFAAAKNHCAIYGAVIADTDKDELKGHDTSKGTIRFSPDKPLPDSLVRKLVKARMAEIEVGAKGYRRNATKPSQKPTQERASQGKELGT